MLLGIVLAGALPKPAPRQMDLQLLAVAGGLIVVVVLVATLNPAVREIGVDMVDAVDSAAA